MKKHIILCVFLFFGIIQNNFPQDKNISSGLYFSSHEVTKDKRTSLHLAPEHPFLFHKKFSISFDASFRRGDGYYGILCRFLGNEEINLDLVSNTASADTNFWLVCKDRILFSFSLNEIPESGFGKWICISIDFDLKQNLLTASFNGTLKKQNVPELSALKNFDIIFGACDNPKFQNTDVAPMTLKNISIRGEDGKTNYSWKLSKHASNFVIDEIHGKMATVKNGIWLIDKHVKWSKKISYNLPNLIGIAKNDIDGVIYFICRTKLYVYSVQSNNLDTINYNWGCPFNNYYNYFIYNHLTNKIISYDFSENYMNEFDFASKKWKQSSYSYKEPDFAHHNSIISPLDSSLVTFGGYGHYSYKSKISSFKTDSELWRTVDVSGSIFPRYLSAAGLDENNNWLIFGGFGSKSGRQEVSPEFFYDLHSYNFKTAELKRLQEYHSPQVPFVPCEGLIKSPDSCIFYTLLYNTNNFVTSLKLAEFRTDKPEYKIYTDTIPYEFSDVESWCVLMLQKRTSDFVTATIHKNDVSIYTLAYPPLFESDAIQLRNESVSIWLFLGIGFVLTGVFVFLYFRKIYKSQHSKSIENDPPILPGHVVDLNSDKSNSKSTINLLGGFQVFDRDGNDISSVFTPTLKQLFVILLLKTIKNRRGISTTQLNETLWFEKSDDSARNNRNVSISKLRTILNTVGNIDIDQESSYWRINMSGVYCDYLEVNMLVERQKEQKISISESEIAHFILVVQRGDLLPEFQLEWLDEFKADFSNMVLDTLFEYSNLPEIQKKLQQLIDISDCILRFDPINENAIIMKCSTLIKMGKKGLAKTVYDHFIKEYENLLGTGFSTSFNDIVGK
jgi:two-component SAPR family response regulator